MRNCSSVREQVDNVDNDDDEEEEDVVVERDGEDASWTTPFVEVGLSTATSTVVGVRRWRTTIPRRQESRTGRNLKIHPRDDESTTLLLAILTRLIVVTVGINENGSAYDERRSSWLMVRARISDRILRRLDRPAPPYLSGDT